LPDLPNDEYFMRNVVKEEIPLIFFLNVKYGRNKFIINYLKNKKDNDSDLNKDTFNRVLMTI